MMKLSLAMFILCIAFFNQTSSTLVRAISLILVSIWAGATSGIIIGFWCFALVVLVFSSGMMVMFLYLTSLASQDKNETPFWSALLIVLTGLLASQITETKISFLENSLTVTSNYSSMNPGILVWVCVYLLLTLLCVCKLAQGFKGSLMFTKFI